MLGRKRIRTDEPAERTDTNVLETLVELQGSARLPIGLRVDAFIERPLPLGRAASSQDMGRQAPVTAPR